MSDAGVTSRSITRVTRGGREIADDAVVVERALEIRLAERSLSVTLRTPGDDEELVLGFLGGEGIIRRRADVVGMDARAADCSDEPDVLDVHLAPGIAIDWTKLERAFVSTSACGLCGRAHLETMRARLAPVASGLRLDPKALLAWPATLEPHQRSFQLTGGIHAAALANDRLELEVLREDVGRHNAVDKVCGWLLERGRYPLGGGVLWVSGRAGAEIVLKAARAGIAVVAAVGAPSSLAVELAEAARLCLVGFLRGERFNVYAGADRLLS
jgi:FdhD protein